MLSAVRMNTRPGNYGVADEGMPEDANTGRQTRSPVSS